MVAIRWNDVANIWLGAFSGTPRPMDRVCLSEEPQMEMPKCHFAAFDHLHRNYRSSMDAFLYSMKQSHAKYHSQHRHMITIGAELYLDH